MVLLKNLQNLSFNRKINTSFKEIECKQCQALQHLKTLQL